MTRDKKQPDGRDDDQVPWPDLYKLAFAEFGTRALWNLKRLEDPKPKDALVVARQLRVEGDMHARKLAESIERLARADL